MLAFETLESSLRMAHNLTESLLSDLSDADLLVRPVPTANHIAWQVGHLITAEYFLIAKVNDNVQRAFPEGWAEKYSKEAATMDDPKHFEGKQRYLELFHAQRQATLEAFQSMAPEKLDQPGPESLRRVVKTVGDLFLFQGHHELMHAGQYSCIRRKLGKPVLI
jgi:uncharacterized damage-inducible protein DinB